MGPFDNNGTEFKFGTLFGDDGDLFATLLVEREQRRLSDEEIGTLVKAHTERGLSLLRDEFDRLNKRGDELMLALLRNQNQEGLERTRPSGSQNPTVPGSYAVDLEIGSDPYSGEPIKHRLNAPGQAPHIAIMGKNGTGKTRLALALLRRLAESAGRELGMIVFDFAKGDIAADREFVRGVGGKAVVLPNEQLLFDPLAVTDQEQNTIKLAARRVRDTIDSVVRLGAVQRERCLDLVQQLYQDYRPETPTLQDLASYAELMAQQNNWKPDSLTAIIKEFGDFPLFLPSDSGASLLDQRVVLDIHNLPKQLRQLTTFLILDRLYFEIMSLEDAPLDSEKNRELRYVVVIDEAHHFLPCKQATLEKMIREVRSKGVVVMLMSQSPDDFNQPNYNFAREMGLSFVFSCFLDSNKMLESFLGANVDTTRVAQLAPGMALARPGGAGGPVELKAW